jgi:hypothetical protein
VDKAEQVRTETYRKITPQRKREISFELGRMARDLKAASLTMKHPDGAE